MDGVRDHTARQRFELLHKHMLIIDGKESLLRDCVCYSCYETGVPHAHSPNNLPLQMLQTIMLPHRVCRGSGLGFPVRSIGRPL
ncbi:unnamed protein product [Calypogeia fissa]